MTIILSTDFSYADLGKRVTNAKIAEPFLKDIFNIGLKLKGLKVYKNICLSLK